MFQRCRPTTNSERELVLYQVGQCLDRLGRADEARKALVDLTALQDARHTTAAAQQRPDDVDLQIRAAEAWLAVGQPDGAIKLLQDFINRSGRNRKVLLALAASYDALGRRDDARQARQDAERSP
jgi:Flp pilus assembly protein TadD